MSRITHTFAALALTCPLMAAAFSPTCAIGLAQCIQIQGSKIPLDDAEAMGDYCADFTRGNIGARVVRMSWVDVKKVAGDNINHPLMRAFFAYGELLDGPLKFDRSLPYEKHYLPVRAACGQVFQALRRSPLE